MFGPGKVLEKSWNFVTESLWEPWVTNRTVSITYQQTSVSMSIPVIAAESSSTKRPDGGTGSRAKSKGANTEEGRAPLMTRMQLNDHKAGMEGLDKEHINQIIYEVSKGDFHL